jgi:hypothetical protein
MQEIFTKKAGKWLFALCLILNSPFSILSCFAQTDTEFWFACPDLSSSHYENCIKIRIISFDEAVSVTLSQPANPSFQTITRNISAQSFTTVELGNLLNYVETKAGDVRNTGILIQSTGKVSAYYANTCDNSEIYALKGRNALGTNFLIPTQYDYPNSPDYGGLCYNKVEIVSAEDSADVTIIPTKACLGYAANVPFTIRLNRGQTFALQASSRAAADHLFGTTVTSTKRIAVNYTDDTVQGPGGDLVGDQLVPVDLLGTKYIAVSNNAGSTNLKDKVYVFPVEDNTQVFFNGTLNATLNKGGKTSFSITDNALLITADKPVSVLHYTYNSEEPGASILPALDCTGSREISYSPTGSQVKVTVLARTEDVYEADGMTGAFRINGQAFWIPPQNFLPVGADNSWSYFRGDVGVSTILKITNTKNALFHAGFFDNPGRTCSFGYFSNYNTVPLESASDRAYYREGETIRLSLNNADDYENIVWKKADGETLGRGAEIQIPNCTQADAGKYFVQGESVIGCYVEPDTFYIHVFAPARAENFDICYGDTLTLNAAGAAPFQWSDGSTANSMTVSPTESTDYWVKSYYPGADASSSFLLTDTFRVAVRDTLRPEILGDEFLYYGSATLTVSRDYETYLWNTGETTKTISVDQASDYWVKVSDDYGCRGSGTFTVQPAPQINVSLLKTGFEVCQGETEFEITYQIIAGEVGSAEISINGASLACNVSATGNKIIVSTGHLAPDIYAAELTVYDATYGTSQGLPITLMVKYPSGIIAQRYNDILGVMNGQHNGGYSFTAFQWYKNSTPMAGETRSYIYGENEFSTTDSYSVLLTNSAGKKIFTCGFSPEHLTAVSDQTLQTLFKPMQTINLNASGTASFYDITGTRYSVQEITNNQAVAPDKRGIYFFQFNGQTIKIIVQ